MSFLQFRSNRQIELKSNIVAEVYIFVSDNSIYFGGATYI